MFETLVLKTDNILVYKLWFRDKYKVYTRLWGHDGAIDVFLTYIDGYEYEKLHQKSINRLIK
jgi:hypothetical protein